MTGENEPLQSAMVIYLSHIRWSRDRGGVKHIGV